MLGTASDVMSGYFQLFRGRVYPTGPLVVKLDTFSAHRAPTARGGAQHWTIQLVFILDVFGLFTAHDHGGNSGANTIMTLMARRPRAR
jgi:hypothetical protein